MTGHRCLIGVDIGGTNTRAQIDGDSPTHSRSVIAPTMVGSTDSVLSGTIDIIESLLSDSPRLPLGGLGIGVPGQVDPVAGSVRLARNLGIGESPFLLRSALTDHFGVPAAIENDVRATSIGLYERASEPKPSILTYLSIGTGVAAGTVIDGHLLRGAGGTAGELGQIIVTDHSGAVATIETEAATAKIIEEFGVVIVDVQRSCAFSSIQAVYSECTDQVISGQCRKSLVEGYPFPTIRGRIPCTAREERVPYEVCNLAAARLV